jgi:2-C-methyl-D-erythritol 4-phosphate cytidylyltransferase
MNIAIITAAGLGKRLPGETKKQFINIAGRPLLFWTIDPFFRHTDIHKIIVTLPSDDFSDIKKVVMTEFESDKIQCIEGGKERQNSVYNALKVCPKETEFVLVHDGVRPFITENDITDLLQLVKEKKAVIPVSPENHTLKTVIDGKVMGTVNRKDVYQVFTPQVFAFDILKNCHEKIVNSNVIFTDDASILEFFDIPVFTKIVSPWNIKITGPEDITIAELIILKGDR